MQLEDIPANVLTILKLRGRSFEAIQKMTPRELFIEFGEWHGVPYPGTFFDLAVTLGGAEAAGKKLTQDNFPQ